MNYDTFRNNLSNLISSHGYNPRTFAMKADISTATISRYLSGDRTPDLPYVIRIANFFNVSVDWLLGLSESFNDLPDESKEILNLYNLAAEPDKVVIRTILNKYAVH